MTPHGVRLFARFLVSGQKCRLSQSQWLRMIRKHDNCINLVVITHQSSEHNAQWTRNWNKTIAAKWTLVNNVVTKFGSRENYCSFCLNCTEFCFWSIWIFASTMIASDIGVAVKLKRNKLARAHKQNTKPLSNSVLLGQFDLLCLLIYVYTTRKKFQSKKLTKGKHYQWKQNRVRK